MPDIVQLLPDNIANQIAAGEVIQRPASAVKELMENAIDASASDIKLVIQDAGKSLVQVIDNGKGMGETDARMAFERHATSKIRNIEDLFLIRTMGFRGEALASIAAVAQVEMKTRKAENETGSFIEIENSKVVRQEPVACAPGTSIAMKNLFFNVPARRNFLKSNAAEMRHIVDEFIRIVLAFPSISFSLVSNGQELFHLEKNSLKQRIVQVLGTQFNARLVSVQEQTDYLTIYGFVGKPDTAKKTRGDQYFFVNNRFIRSAYLNHAVMSAYQDMIPSDSYPLYALFIDLDPSHVDINVHPTKQEIKFEDERIIYAFVQAAVKHALAQFSITPSLDFDLDPDIQRLDAVAKPFTEQRKSEITSSGLYQTFTQKNQAHLVEPSQDSDLRHWKKDNTGENELPSGISNMPVNRIPWDESSAEALAFRLDIPVIQLLNTYLVATTNTGFMLVHQQSAHERILYEKYLAALNGKRIAVQHSLFPVTIQLTAPDAILLGELIPDLHELGYLIEPFGKDSFIIQGTPADLDQGRETAVLEAVLEQFKHYSNNKLFSVREKLIRSMANQRAIKAGKSLMEDEMGKLLEGLFSCEQPNMSPDGKPTYWEFNQDQLQKIFNR
ncbi:MAG: DNA mismatch repair protein MutL [Bacteroidetes bacterium]|nr:MAG: DNA mismatch repair protein MutL [Bacteroidota bacterium]